MGMEWKWKCECECEWEWQWGKGARTESVRGPQFIPFRVAAVSGPLVAIGCHWRGIGRRWIRSDSPANFAWCLVCAPLGLHLATST